MHMHEFLAKELLSRRGVAIPAGRVAATAEDAQKVVQSMTPGRYVVKAQIHAGDRFANGGIRFADNAGDARIAAAAMLGKPLVTRQTGLAGEMVRWVYVEEAVTAITNLYIAIAVDRAAGEIVALGANVPVDDGRVGAVMDRGQLQRTAIRIEDDKAVADFAGLAARIAPATVSAAELAALIERLANMLIEFDAILIEINPLAVAPGGGFIAVDAKMTVDDNALFRHRDLASLRQVDANVDGDPTELQADRRHINYVALDGNIGVVVNGAGLALATLDALVEAGGRPANFMDVRTTATSLDIAYAFNLVLANKAVRAVLLNVHGGGMQRCDTIVEGMAIAMRRGNRSLPVVARLAGNNADFARDRLKSFGIKFVEGTSIGDAARRAAAMVSKEVV
ncbi:MULTISPECIES: ATP-grasp domain-containing protein [Rhodomicrobium]|uniref:ATP-grasp domain-containing protein n=1 Tax=Rhodomicrobium TaxID=1068 RepID=UPI000B4AC920|nr:MULTISPECIES: ATP-grasp domain-containing protein [Rhodomicrobium]